MSGAGGLGGPNLGQPQVPAGPLLPHQQGVAGPAPTVYTVAGSAPGMPQPQFAAAQQLAAVAIQQAQVRSFCTCYPCLKKIIHAD